MSKIDYAGQKGMEICVSWQPFSDGRVPENAVEAAPDCYVGRAKWEGNWVPAKVVVGHQCAYLPHGCKEHSVSEYEVLVCTEVGCYGKGFHWVGDSNGNAPKKALVAGRTAEGAPLYVARGQVNGDWCVGKVHRDHGCAYFPWGGEEHRLDTYEVLVLGC